MSKQLLTEKQELFAVEYVLNGGNATQAYRDVYDTKTTSENSLYVKAHEVLHNDKVSVRVHSLQMAKYSTKILSIEERKQLLTETAKAGDIKAIEMLNKMDGVYVEKKEVEVKVTNMDVLFK